MKQSALERKIQELELLERLRKLEAKQDRREISRQTIASQPRDIYGRIGRIRKRGR
jgi:hypothetical protein